jgi:phosphopantothenoylcysteine decarboxylase/phosphopantothenate--cysteine ligase
MNTHMLNHPFTQEHLELIGKLDRLENIFIHPTAEGLLACGDEGAGKLASVEKMFSVITSYPNKRINKRVLITTGASEAPLDPVRFVTNPSSGTTGYELAKTALQRGYDVTVLAGNSATSKLELLDHLPGYSLIRLRTTEDFLDAVEKLLPEHDTYISSAALSDLSFETASGKLKKNELGSTLNVGKAPDVLKYALENKTKQTIVGFAAETDLSTSVISEKYKRKPTDFLIGTRVHSGDDENETAGFKTDQANYVLYKKDQLIEQGSLTKTQMASWLFDQLEASVD